VTPNGTARPAGLGRVPTTVGPDAVTGTAPDEKEHVMNISTTSAPARTDAYATTAPPTSRVTSSGVRRLALGLSTGAAIWAAASYAFGFTPASEIGWKVTDLGGLAFQAGVMCLVQLQLRTRATGTTRKAVAMLKVERVVLGLAMVWSLVHGLVPSARDDLWLAVLDVCWPLSMLGMFVIGVKVALEGRWRGVARVYPLVAESWVVVSVPSLAIFGPAVGDLVGATHLLAGYATLGLLVATRPHLVLPRETAGS
jgi:hypothetical protein